MNPLARPGQEYTDDLGRMCEGRVLHALAHPDRPWWILKVRHAREREDVKKGVDIVVQIDAGRVFLQVKRSRRGVAEWLARWGSDPRPIGVVVVAEQDPEPVVYGRALGALILLRERLERERQHEEAAPC